MAKPTTVAPPNADKRWRLIESAMRRHGFRDDALIETLHTVQECFGDTIGWLDWLRPGFQLGLAIRDFQTAHPEAEGVMMGGHGMMVWADTSAACEALSLRVIEQAEQFLARRGKSDPFGLTQGRCNTRECFR